MTRTLNLIVVAASAAALTGCARTTLLINHHEAAKPSSTSTTGTSTTSTSTTSTSTTSTTTTPSPAAVAYLAALNHEQARLAAAERKIPRGPRTPAGLAHSIQLLRAAIVRLGHDLQRISPPPDVASQHAQLVSIMQTYADRLGAAASTAVKPGGQLRAANMLISATTAASSAFSSTVSQISSALR
ncbi:MAG TPA: hypothetical protein VGN29_07870 [Solirubrobacteraceae bacterium]|jgi:hypothetical protein|nr:hypothetical protein [Solirubrobacteraceae bacterium]